MKRFAVTRKACPPLCDLQITSCRLLSIRAVRYHLPPFFFVPLLAIRKSCAEGGSLNGSLVHSFRSDIIILFLLSRFFPQKVKWPLTVIQGPYPHSASFTQLKGSAFRVMCLPVAPHGCEICAYPRPPLVKSPHSTKQNCLNERGITQCLRNHYSLTPPPVNLRKLSPSVATL